MALVPHVGYRWVRDDPKITPGWTDPGNSGSGTGKSGKTGKSVSRPFCPITAEPGHLQTWQGYPRIGLDLRITLVPLKIRKSGSGPSQSRKTSFPVSIYGGIVVRILHHVTQLHDMSIFVQMIFFGGKAAWVYQAHDTVQLNLIYMMIGLTHNQKQTSCN